MGKAAHLITLILAVFLIAIPVSAQETAPTEAGGVLAITQKHTIATREAPAVSAESGQEVTVTAFMDRKQLGWALKSQMENAYKELVFTKSLDKAIPQIEDLLSEEQEISDLAVCELFHVNTGTADTLEFALDLAQEDFLLVVRCVYGEYEILEDSLVTITEDGHVQAEFQDSPGILAFITLY